MDWSDEATVRVAIREYGRMPYYMYFGSAENDRYLDPAALWQELRAGWETEREEQDRHEARDTWGTD